MSTHPDGKAWKSVPCERCGGPATLDMVQMSEDTHVHRGPCHQRAVVNDDGADMRRRLHAALELFDYRQSPLLGFKVDGKPLLGVLVNHRLNPDRWVVEDSEGVEHEFATVDELEVVDDYFDVAA